MVGVAQLVELLVVVQAVAGSSPVAHPSYKACKYTPLRGCARVDRPGKVQAVAPVLKLCRPAGLGDKSERLDVAWAHDAEMPLIERRDHLQVAALGERDHRGVNHPQRQVEIFLHQL